jgi:hypothetical protein
VGSPNPHEVEKVLEELRQHYPEPFGQPSGLDDLFALPAAREVLEGGRTAAQELLEYIDRSDRPDLIRIAILLLSQLDADDIYPGLLRRLAQSDETRALVFEPGFWLLRVPEPQLVGDIVRVVEESGNPSPLLLLQRPSAAAVKPALRRFVERRQLPLSRNALYAYEYMLEPGDRDLLRAVAFWDDAPELAGLAGLYLLRLGSAAEGVEGLRAALTTGDEAIRSRIYFELAQLLPPGVVADAGFDPTAPADSQSEALDRVLSVVARRG